jgi:serine/threonine-protein kinase
VSDNNPPATGLVGGRYELGELLGRGGMAEVRKGHDTRLGRVVAIKRLRTDLASDATFQARFRREAQSAASLNHPAIVAVYDTGEEPAADGSGIAQPYIVMEFVAGRTLRDILREGRKILPERALEITSGVLSALDYSHRAGIIHRDIKPGNVMLTPSGDVKVMDFGIARAISDASSTMTQTAAVVGTAQYLSPEQARGETVDSRSDVYSAGCLLYELLTGRPPFVGDSPVAVAYQHVREPARPPSDHDTDLPPAVDAIVMKALAKRLEDRYQSAAAMRSDIERYLAGRPVQAPVPLAADPPPVVVPPVEATTVRPPLPPDDYVERDDVYDRGRGGPRTSVLVLLGLLVVALIVGAWLVLRSDLFESAPEKEQVPNLIGMTEADARTAIGDAGLNVGNVDFEPSENADDKDKVTDQTPSQDEYVDPNTSVDIVISSGLPQVEVPFLVGATQDEARNKLREAKLSPEFKSVESDEPQGQVLETSPAGGEEVDQNSTVSVTISKGPKTVPNVIGLNRSDAIKAIVDAGFAYDIRGDDRSTEPRGTVTDQIPKDGTLPQGQTVTLFVSTYEPPPPPPTTDPTAPPVPTETPTLRQRVPDARADRLPSRPPGRTAGSESRR